MNDKDTGSSTSNPSEANATIVISDTETEPENAASTIQEGTASPRSNIKPTSQVFGESGPESQPHSAPLPVDSIAATNLPYQILDYLGVARRAAHFVLIAPGTPAALVTPETVSEIPPGTTITLTFDSDDLAWLPATHIAGKVYIVTND